MIKYIIGAVVVLGLLILAISAYLGPDNLRSCGPTPSGNGACRRADAIVAVSGGDTDARANEAIKLYLNGWGDKLIFSGAAQDKSGPSNAKVMERDALAAGVPEGVILIDQSSESTTQNAANTHTIFDENNIKSVILVTSAYHQRRAFLEFSKYHDISVRNHPVAQDDQWSGLWWLTPVGWWLALGELIKISMFYVGGTR